MMAMKNMKKQQQKLVAASVVGFIPIYYHTHTHSYVYSLNEAIRNKMSSLWWIEAKTSTTKIDIQAYYIWAKCITTIRTPTGNSYNECVLRFVFTLSIQMHSTHNNSMAIWCDDTVFFLSSQFFWFVK